MKKILICLICFLILTGCRSGSDYIEPESRIIVSAIGVDSLDENILLTAEYININTTNNDDSYKIKIITGLGKNMQTAVSDLETKIDGKLMLSQCPILILNTSLDNVTLNNIYDCVLFEENISLSIRLVSSESAYNLISANKDNKPSGYQIMSLLRFSENSLGTTKGDSLVKILNRELNDLYKIPFVEHNGTYQVSGCNYFKSGISGELDLLESQILYMLSEELLPCKISVGNDSVNFKKCKIKEENNILSVKVTLKNMEKINSFENFKNSFETAIVTVLNKFGYTKPLKLRIVGEA